MHLHIGCYLFYSIPNLATIKNRYLLAIPFYCVYLQDDRLKNYYYYYYYSKASIFGHLLKAVTSKSGHLSNSPFQAYEEIHFNDPLNSRTLHNAVTDTKAVIT